MQEERFHPRKEQAETDCDTQDFWRPHSRTTSRCFSIPF